MTSLPLSSSSVEILVNLRSSISDTRPFFSIFSFFSVLGSSQTPVVGSQTGSVIRMRFNVRVRKGIAWDVACADQSFHFRHMRRSHLINEFNLTCGFRGFNHSSQASQYIKIPPNQLLTNEKQKKSKTLPKPPLCPYLGPPNMLERSTGVPPKPAGNKSCIGGAPIAGCCGLGSRMFPTSTGINFNNPIPKSAPSTNTL